MLPKHIRIGGTDYALSEIADLRDGDLDLNGHITYNDQTINIEAKMSPHVKWLTVWHEVLHGILSHAGIDEQDEQTVLALGYGITQVLRDNEWLREFTNETS
jgi:hypothetical protein